MQMVKDIYILRNFHAWGNATLYALIVSRLLKILDFDFTMSIPPATRNYTHKYTIIQKVPYMFQPFIDHPQGGIQQ